MTVFPGKGYNEIDVGDEFGAAVTITDAHLVLAAGLIGDAHPLHINQQYAERTRFGGRVLHGVFTGALAGGPVGTFFCRDRYRVSRTQLPLYRSGAPRRYANDDMENRCKGRQAEARGRSSDA